MTHKMGLFIQEIKNKKGLSLVSVMVSVGILGIITLGITQLLSNTFNSQRFIQQRQAAFGLQMSAIGILSDRAICELNFRNRVIDPNIELNQVRSSPTNIHIQTGSTYDNNLLQVTQVRLTRFNPYASVGVNSFRGLAFLTIEMQGVGSGVSGKIFGREVALAVELKGFTGLVPANEIQTCVAVGNDINDIWKLKPSGDIYYQGFNVGIGTDDPNQMLEVSGNVLAASYLHSSDRQLKKEVRNIENHEDLHKINGVHFIWKKDEEPGMGLIAQEVEAYFPEAVTTNPKTGLKMVSYDLLIAPLIESNKSLRARVEFLEAQQKKIFMDIQGLKK